MASSEGLGWENESRAMTKIQELFRVEIGKKLLCSGFWCSIAVGWYDKVIQ